MARKAIYTDEHRQKVIARLSLGETLRQICRSRGYPAQATVIGWTLSDQAFAEQYARARSLGLDVMAEEIIAIADVSREGVKTEEKQVGWQCPKCRLPVAWRGSGWVHDTATPSALCEGIEKPDRIIETKTVSTDMVERARLQVDARKWLLSKMRPDKYGDKTAVELTGSLTTMTLAETLRARRSARTGDTPAE